VTLNVCHMLLEGLLCCILRNGQQLPGNTALCKWAVLSCDESMGACEECTDSHDTLMATQWCMAAHLYWWVNRCGTWPRCVNLTNSGRSKP
jgi:hypothetical protein